MDDCVKIKSSYYIIGKDKYTAARSAKLRRDNIELQIDISKERVLLQCSFKHIYQAELLDNAEKQGAGLVLYLDEMSAKKIQMAIDPSGNTIYDANRKTPDTKWFIIMDIINFDAYTLTSIREMLERCDQFHKKHIIDSYLKRGDDPGNAKDLRNKFTKIINITRWNEVKDSIEKIDIEDHKPMESIIHSSVEHQIIYRIQADGKMLPVLNGIPELVMTTDIKHTVDNKLPEKADSPGLSLNMEHMILAAPPSPPIIRPVHKQEPANSLNHSEPNNNGHNLINPIGVRCESTVSNVPIGNENDQARGTKRKCDAKDSDLIDDDDIDKIAGPSKRARDNEVVLNYPSKGRDSIPLHFADLRCLDEQIMLNDTIIEFYLKYIMHHLVPEERRNRIHIFSTFFYSKLTKVPGKHLNLQRPAALQATRMKRIFNNYQTLKTWTRRVNLFEKDYIIIPINEDIHWYLAVIINPKAGIEGPNPDEKSRNFYVIIFDSLLEPERHRFIQETLGEYLRLEYLDKKEINKLPGTAFKGSCLKKILPKDMPQQKNEIDCGLYLCHFAEAFMTSPPQYIGVHSSFRDWYPDFDIKQKRQSLQYIIKELARVAGNSVYFTDFLFDPTEEETKTDINKWIQAEKAKMSRGSGRRTSDSNVLDIFNDSKSIPLKRSRSQSDLAELQALQQLNISDHV